MIDTLYKILGPDMSSCHGGTGKWRLNRWRGVRGHLMPCSNGIHLCRVADLSRWLKVGKVYIAEWEGERLDEHDKVVVRRARIVAHVGDITTDTIVHIACDAAEHVLHIFEEKFPDDKRPRKGIDAARNGNADAAAYTAAANAAHAAAKAAYAANAGRAAGYAANAAGYAADAAVRAAYAAYAAGYAGYAADAAGRAANAAYASYTAYAAFGAAANAAERQWQGERLLALLGDDDE